MTDLQTRPRPAAPPDRRRAATRPPSLVLHAVGAAAWSAGVGLVAVAVVVLLAWSADGRSGASAADAVRAAVRVWLLAHHTGLSTSAGPVGLVPLGLTALPAWLLYRAGVSLARTVAAASLRDAGRAITALAGAYALLAAVVTGPAGDDAVRPAPWQALAGAGVLAVLAGGAGVFRTAGCWPQAMRRVPVELRAALRGGAVAAALLLGAGAVLVVVAVLLHLGRATDLAGALGTGVVGGAALVLLQLAYVPVAAVWGAAVLAGPGFALGAGTGVSAFGSDLGPVPALPLLAALPAGDGRSPLGPLLLAVPLLAGAVGGRLVGRALRSDCGNGRPLTVALVLRDAAVAGTQAGVLLGVAAWLAGGPLGAGRLATVGPSPLRVAAATAVEVFLAAAAAAWWWAGRPRRLR